MKIYLNFGNNIEMLEEMKEVILLVGGMFLVRVILCGFLKVLVFLNIKFDGVGLILNV